MSTEVTDHELMKAFNPFGFVQRTLIDKKHWQGLVRFETIEACTRAYADMHGKDLLGRRLLVRLNLYDFRINFFRHIILFEFE